MQHMYVWHMYTYVEGRCLRPGLSDFEIEGRRLRLVLNVRRVFETAGLL